MNGKITLRHSTNWHLLTRSAIRKIGAADGLYYPLVYITRTAGRADHLKRRFVESAAAGAGVVPPIFSWNQFWEKVFDQLPVAKQRLSLSDQLFLIYQTVQSLADRLVYFSFAGRPFSPQIINSLQSMLNAYLMRHPTEAISVAESDDPFHRELELIIRNYQQAKGDWFWDEADLLNFVLENGGEPLRDAFPQTNRLLWEIDAPVYPLQLRVMEKAKEMGWEVELLLFYGTNEDFFQNMDDIYQRIRKMAGPATELADPTNLSQTIFTLSDEQVRLNKELEIARYPDRMKEVEAVVKRIKRELIDAGADATQIGITAGNISQYLPLLKNALSKYGVPFTVGGAVLLSELLPIQHLQLPLELVQENGELPALKRLLKSPFFNYNEVVREIPWEEILNSLRIQFDLSTIIGQLLRSIEYDETQTSDRRSQESARQKRILLEVLEKVRADIQPLTKSFTAADFFDFFSSLLRSHRIVSRILEWRDSLPSRNIADILGAIRMLISGLDVWRSQTHRLDPQREYHPSQALQFFRMIISSLQFEPYQPHHYGVQVFHIHAAETFNLKTLYVLGLSEDEFPGRGQEALHNLSEPFSRLMSHNRLLEDRRLFLKLLQMPLESIRLSYPEREGESLKVASNLIFELERLTGVKSSSPEPDSVFSRSEIFGVMKHEIEKENAAATGLQLIAAPEISHFKRQMKIVGARNALDQPFGIYEGDLSSEGAITGFLARQCQTREFSVSALETYAKSPIQYFFRRILHVNEPETFEDWMTPIEKGKMVHRVLFRFYAECSEDDRTLENLLRIAEQEIEQFPFLPSILWDLQKEAFLGSRQRKGLFRAFLEHETEQLQASPLNPQYFEVPFGEFSPGMKTSLSPGFDQPFEIRQGESSLKLRGIVDRIETTDDGGILVVDYKTGMTAKFQEIYEGRSLQLPLYLQAIIHFLRNENPTYFPLGACFYQIKEEDEVRREILFAQRGYGLDARTLFPTNELGHGLEEISLQDFLEQSNDYAMQYAGGIRQGRFHHHENTRDCEMGDHNICPFEPLCRVNRTKLRELLSRRNGK